MTASDVELRARLHDTGAHPTVIGDLLDTGHLKAALEAAARWEGTDDPGRDYQAEAEDLAPAVLLWMLQPPREEGVTATAATIAAFHAAA